MLRFNDIADRVLEYAPDSDLELLHRAYVFTAKVHKDQKRHDMLLLTHLVWAAW